MTSQNIWGNGDLEFKHETVLLTETIDALQIKPDGIYVDGTLGGGGHSFKIVQKLKTGRVIGIDQDKEAIEAAYRRLKIFTGRVSLVNDNYVNIKHILENEKVEAVDGIVLDLGVSSYQIDNPERGFSYINDAPLDMRMNTNAPLSAKDVVNTYSMEELIRILRDFGEEKFAVNIAQNIVREREKQEISTTLALAQIVSASVPKAVSKGSKGVSKKTFQALRIEVNSELSVLEEALEIMVDLLKPKGRLAVITFHSLEDRIVKNAFRSWENPCTCPPDFPVCVCGRVSKGKVITKKPITPSKEEVERNKRSASAKLRIFEKK